MNFNQTPQMRVIGSGSKPESKQNRLKRNSQLIGSPSAFNTSTTLDKRIKVEYENRFNQYEFSLNLYAIPPFGQINLEEAQSAVEERLKILSVFDDVQAEKARARGDFNYTEELNVRFRSLGDVFINEVSGGKENKKVHAARRRDHISHFLLRLLACQNDQLKKWFIQKEVELLRYRLESEKNTLDLVKLLIYNNLNFQEIAAKEKQVLLKQIKINYNSAKANVTNVYYKIPFEEALELVRMRRVYLQDGFCYCSSNEMVTIISAKFRLELSRSLGSLSNCLPQLDENHRLQPIFQTIYKNLIKSKKSNSQTNGNKETITPDMIDELAVTSFPPCMRNTHELLRMNHHLKHYGRLHYGLFLKGIGLSLEDALSFFRDEFIQSITPEKFQKEYSYNIRYNYGKEGKRVNMSAISCAKIINGNTPGIGDSHGCPFKHFDTSNLTKMLKKHKVDDECIKEIVELSEAQKPTTACSCYFSAKNKNVRLQQDIYHPNQYFIESRKIAKNLHLIRPPASEADQHSDQHADLHAEVANPTNPIDNEQQVVADSTDDTAKPNEVDGNTMMKDVDGEAPLNEVNDGDTTMKDVDGEAPLNEVNDGNTTANGDDKLDMSLLNDMNFDDSIEV